MIPTTMLPMAQGIMQSPMDINGQQNGKKTNAGFDPLAAIFSQPSQILGGIISNELMQASQKGIGSHDLLGTLVQMAQATGQSIGTKMFGSGGPGGQPPTQNGNNGNKPPQDPGAGVKQDNQQQSSEDNSTGNYNNIINSLLTNSGQNGLSSVPTAQQTAGRFIYPQQGGLFQGGKVNPDGSYRAAGPLGIFGMSPEEYQSTMNGNALNPANKTQETAVEAAIKPITQSEKLSQGVTAYTAQRQAFTEELKNSTEVEKNLLTELQSVKDLPGGALFQRDKIAQIQENLRTNRNYMAKLQSKFGALTSSNNSSKLQSSSSKSSNKSSPFKVGQKYNGHTITKVEQVA